MTRTPAPGAPHSVSVSVFLRSYAPDTFEWEDPAYDPRASFVWSKPLVSSAPGSWSPRSHYQYHYQDAAHCEGRTSPGSESLSSDMSISLSDAGSGLSFSMLPPMIRTRAASVSSGRPLVLGSGSSSLSDMSISPTPSIPSQSPDKYKYERFIVTQSTWDPPANSAFLEGRPSLLDTESIEYSASEKSEDGGLDPVAVSEILEWTISLFTSVASSSLDYTIQPDVDDDPGSTYPDSPSLENEEGIFSPCSKDSASDSCLLSSKVVVRLNSTHPKGPPRSVQANPNSILMPGAVDYEAINPEQATTAKPVCMWGRRLERIPKVRLAGQQEAVYCFDSRKQRQKQRGPCINVVQRQPARQGVGAFRYKEQQKPTQVFYRARPLGAPLIRRDLPVAPVDAVKIAQGQVLLQNVAPIRFSTTSAPAPCNRGALQEPSGRLPFASRSNWADNCHRTEYAASPLFVKKISARGFL
ncbi:hypothetical protein ACEPAF_7075 [Sanghuangporus sanghuang]